MFERDGDQCTWVDERTGKRCPSRVFLQKDHIRERAHGGGHDLTNVRSLCGPHNLLHAELTFGREYVQHRIHLRQQKSTTKEDPAQ